jgi:hypothetical protein
VVLNTRDGLQGALKRETEGGVRRVLAGDRARWHFAEAGGGDREGVSEKQLGSGGRV